MAVESQNKLRQSGSGVYLTLLIYTILYCLYILSICIQHLTSLNYWPGWFSRQEYWSGVPLSSPENRVYRPPNTVHQHPGQEYPKCDLVFARSSLTDSWTTPSIYTACARPVLSFPRSKTEKYSLRKTSPRIQVSLDVLTMFSWKVVLQWPLESWGSQRHTPVSMSPYVRLPQISSPSTTLGCISLFW